MTVTTIIVTNRFKVCFQICGHRCGTRRMVRKNKGVEYTNFKQNHNMYLYDLRDLT